MYPGDKISLQPQAALPGDAVEPRAFGQISRQHGKTLCVSKNTLPFTTSRPPVACKQLAWMTRSAPENNLLIGSLALHHHFEAI